MTFLAPILFVGFYATVIWVAMGSVEKKTIQVIDESKQFASEFKDSNSLHFEIVEEPLEVAKNKMAGGDASALVYIPKDMVKDSKGLRIYSQKNVSLELKSEIEKQIEHQIESIKLAEAGITHRILEDSRVNVSSQTISLEEGEEKNSSSGAATVIGGVCAFLIYFSVMVYGTQVMRGITEEKTSRIVEVIISSVKPFQLMMGKIIGVALVGLTQFLLWITLTLLLATATSLYFKDQLPQDQTQMEQVQKSMPGGAITATSQVENPMTEVLGAVNSLNIPLILGCFLFYFLGGYLLYSALFGAVGAAVDSDSDTQQFMLPITLPIVFSFVFAQFVLRDPDGSLAFWTSMIPFTSPIIMMVRIPFGVPAWELALSMTLLVAGFIVTIWLASRIYRVGILMYGKKVSYKELAKWIFYR